MCFRHVAAGGCADSAGARHEVAAPPRLMGDIEELIDLVLAGQHPILLERCVVDRIVSVFEGRVACWLVADNYGKEEWWLLLEPEPAAPSSLWASACGAWLWDSVSAHRRNCCI